MPGFARSLLWIGFELALPLPPARAARGAEGLVLTARRLRALLPSLSILGPILAIGCGAPALPDYSSASLAAPARARTVEREGLVATVDPFSDRERSEKFFGMNALARGVLILHLRVENRSGDQTWLLQRDGCSLVSGERAAHSSSGDRPDMVAAETISVVGMAAGSFPLLLVGNSIISKNTEIQRNFSEKELVSRTLSRGQAVEGFLYYRVEKGPRALRGELRIPLTSTRTRETITLSVPVDSAHE